AETDDLHAVADHDLVELRALDVAALLDREIDDDRAGLHRRDCRGLDELRRGTARNERGRDQDVDALAALVNDAGLASHPFGRHRPRVAAHTFRDLALLVVSIRNID